MHCYRCSHSALSVVVLSIVSSVLAANNCTLRDEASGNEFDLSALSSPADYDIEDSKGSTIKLNICRSVVTDVGSIDKSEKVGIYRLREDRSECLGAVHEDPIMLKPPKGEAELYSLSLTYPDGSSCPSGGQYSSVLLLECDRAVYGTGHPVLVGTSSDGCAHFFAWRTQSACPHPPSRGIGSAILVFLAVAVVAVVVAIGSSVAYNRLVLRKRGLDQFPSVGASNGGFLGTLAERIRSFRDRFTSRDRAYFRGLPTDPHEAQDLFGDFDEDDE